MKNTLAATFYCDHGEANIQKMAEILRRGSDDPVQIAKETFLFVRDQVPFGFDLYRRKASETLERGYGVCWNKSLLLTALLRCNNIESHLGVIPMKRTFIAPVIKGLSNLANEPYNHFMVYAFLHDKWIILDSVLDQRTYDTFFKPLKVDWGINWNGHDDCRLYLESVIGPPELREHTDNLVHTRGGNTEFPKYLAMTMYRVVNRRIWKKARIELRAQQAISLH